VVVVVDEGGKTTRRGGCDKKNLKRNGNVGDRRVRLLAIRGLALVEADWDAAGLAPSLPYSCVSATLRGVEGVQI
jgi:hypothetical protein